MVTVIVSKQNRTTFAYGDRIIQ